jgi:hypothetical protein
MWLEHSDGWRFLTAFICVCSFAIALRADVIVTEDNVLFGKILSINSESALIARECNNKLTEDIERSRIQTIIFDTGCAAHPYSLPASATSACETEKIPAFRLQFRDDVAPIYATKLLSKGDAAIHMLLAGGDGSLHGPLDRITSITNGRFCPELFLSRNVTRKDFCLEPPKMAVNWSPEPVHNNTIFTKGFSFYLDQIGRPRSAAPTIDFSGRLLVPTAKLPKPFHPLSVHSMSSL